MALDFGCFLRFGFWSGLFLVLPIAGCSCDDDDAGPASVSNMPGPDAGDGDDIVFDASIPRPVRDAGIDVDDLIPGDPPEGLEADNCAVDTNKLFRFENMAGPPESASMAVDQVASEFGMVWIDESADCYDAIKMARFSGPSGSGDPEEEVVVDACSAIEQVAVTHTFETWLIATADDRAGPADIWVQSVDDEVLSEHQISENPRIKSELAVGTSGTDFAGVAWVEVDRRSLDTSLHYRALSGEGEPIADEVVLVESAQQTVASLTVAPIGTDYMAVGYRRSNSSGSRIVLEILDGATGERVRDPWVLTELGGNNGTIELATEEDGGGVVYTIAQGTGRQLWFQRLDAEGLAAPVTGGTQTGGASEPQRVVGLPMVAVDASMAKLANGYIVAYRALSGGAIEEPTIRVVFLDRFGRIIGDSSVAYASEQGSRTSIEVAYDGRVSLGWADAYVDGSDVSVVRLPCVGGVRF
ncbi:MAG: hypothetical protein PVI30_06910 [Myxococcales bacterium]